MRLLKAEILPQNAIDALIGIAGSWTLNRD
jgi:hypothetical protein